MYSNLENGLTNFMASRKRKELCKWYWLDCVAFNGQRMGMYHYLKKLYTKIFSCGKFNKTCVDLLKCVELFLYRES